MPIPPPRTPIDPDEVLRLRTGQGLSGAEIASRLGYSAPAIRRVLKRLGESLRPNRRVSDVRWGERLYSLWSSVRQRCSNPRNPLFPRYGGRGVVICAEWEEFWAFYDWAIVSGYRPGMSLVLDDHSGRFSQTTCIWIPRRECMRRNAHKGGANPAWQITALGETKTPSEWVKDRRCQVTADALRSRIRYGVPPEDAITLPPNAHLPKDGRRARQSRGPRKLVDWDRAVRLYTESGLRPGQIAGQLQANESTIRKGLKSRGVWEPPKAISPHGARLRKIFEDVHRRCEDEADPSFVYYGARGARVCSEWRVFRVFHKWATEHGYEPGLCLSRRKGTKVYSPRNCFWTTRAEAVRAASHPDSSMPPLWTVWAFGEEKGPTEWSRDERCKVSLSGLIRRLRGGWRPEDAIADPPMSRSSVDGRGVRAFGTTKSLSAWERDPRCRVTRTTLAERLDRGVPQQDAISTRPYGL